MSGSIEMRCKDDNYTLTLEVGDEGMSTLILTGGTREGAWSRLEVPLDRVPELIHRIEVLSGLKAFYK